LAIPSIITSTGSSLTPKIEITNSNSLSGTLLFHGRTLKNASAFNPNLTPVFSGSGKVLTTSTEITSLMTSLKNTYTSSGAPDVKSNTSIASLLTMNTGSLSELGVNLVKNELGISGVSGGPENTDTTVSGTCTSLPSNAVYFSNTASYSLVSAPSGTSLSAVTAGYSASPVTNTCQFKCGGGFSWNGGSCGETPLYTFTSHTFTNCGQVGGTGPSLANCRSSYGGGVAWAQDTTNNYLNMSTNGIQLWTVPSTGTYTIDTYGAKGGAGSFIGGNGTRMKGDFDLTRGQIIKILVGQIGGNYSYTAGGGGGTFISTSANIPLIIAGGGGGGGNSGGNGFAATTATSGVTGNGGQAGGLSGNATTATGNGGWGSSGGGFFTNSVTSQDSSSYASAPFGFVNGGVGATAGAGASTSSCVGAWGGFGGGGGGACNGGGGGGGYSGGGNGGGGGGSYNNGTNQVNTNGVGTGDGYVVITRL
ncbi:MAG: hypothetical protein PHU93_05010, partial [Candidatus Gracilibacteria bacterium]|nr:hypothetical protein [Candidatus Gracilibacteria bacterium]